MEWVDVFKFIILITGSFGGASVIVIGVIKYFANIFAERSLKKYELKLENKSYVSRARFDVEFNAYKEISHKFLVLFDEINKITPGYNGLSAKINTDNITGKLKEIKELLYGDLPIISEEIYNFLNSVLLIFSEQFECYKAILNSNDEKKDNLITREALEKLRQDVIDKLRDHFISLDVMD